MAEARRVPMEETSSQHYNRVIREGGLITDSPTPGFWTLLPRSNSIWNSIRQEMTRRMARKGVGEVTMPTLFPLGLLEKEAEHVQGFAPEVFTVTKAGTKEFADPLVVRPTSEVVMTELMKGMVQSHRDLPLMLNQWGSAFRAEKRPRPFLRTTEFLWQEGYSAHATPEEADAHAREMAEFYQRFMAEQLSLWSLIGEKSDGERFPGAIATYALEASLGGKALQLATAHYLGTGFTESQGVRFADKDGELKAPHQTSWGSTTRMIGAMILEHCDALGIVVPPQVSPEQVTIVPAWRNVDDKGTVEEFANQLKGILGRGAVVAKRDEGQRLGAVRYDVERTGSPVQIVVGQREIDSGNIPYTLRHSGEGGNIAARSAHQTVPLLLAHIADELLAASAAKQAAAVVDMESGGIDAMSNIINEGKMVLAGWSGGIEEEKRLNEETGITIRVHPFNYDNRRDPFTDREGRAAIFAKSY